VRINISCNGAGYVEVIADSWIGRYTVKHHRLIMYAKGDLESPFQAYDDKEVHHKNGVSWDNRPSNMVAVTSEEHRRIDEKRRMLPV